MWFNREIENSFKNNMDFNKQINLFTYFRRFVVRNINDFKTP